MLDIILLSFVLGVFYGGFWCGKKFQTLGAMLAAIKGWFA